jgi:hypothetical protein
VDRADGRPAPSSDDVERGAGNVPPLGWELRAALPTLEVIVLAVVSYAVIAAFDLDSNSFVLDVLMFVAVALAVATLWGLASGLRRRGSRARAHRRHLTR